MKFRSKYNHGVTNCGYLHRATLKALYGFKEKKSPSGKRFFFQSVQNKIFEILKIQLLNYLKNKQQRQKHHTHDVLILSLLLVIIMV